jgi:hypothetical protein
LIYTIAGCWFLGQIYQQRARNMKKALNKNLEEKKVKILFVSISIFLTFVILALAFVPDSAKLGHLDIMWERKKFFGVTFMCCADVVAIGLSIAFWRKPV